eukprot:g74584.t1
MEEVAEEVDGLAVEVSEEEKDGVDERLIEAVQDSDTVSEMEEVAEEEVDGLAVEVSEEEKDGVDERLIEAVAD